MKTLREWQEDGSIDFWDCREDRETLSHEAIEEAIEAYVDDELSPGCDVEKVVREAFPGGLTVYGFRRRKVAVEWLRDQADLLAERFRESFDEEYGGGDDGSMIGDVGEEHLHAQLRTALESMMPHLEAWQCEREVEVTIPLEELLAALREWCPDWFATEAT